MDTIPRVWVSQIHGATTKKTVVLLGTEKVRSQPECKGNPEGGEEVLSEEPGSYGMEKWLAVEAVKELGKLAWPRCLGWAAPRTGGFGVPTATPDKS